MDKSMSKTFLLIVLLVLSTVVSSHSFAKETKDIPVDGGKEKCEDFVGMSISKSVIGLRTSGAEITSADFISDTSSDEYCQVNGAIHPVDSTAPDINFQVNLPMSWNQKVLQMGGGGFNGVLVTGLDNNRYDPEGSPTPLEKGYVTFGSDSGHQSTDDWDGSFAANEESLENFAGDQLKKTYDTAIEIIEKYYQEEPSRVYFSGGSEGGREGLVAIQRWPQDYDGAVVLYPVYNWIAKAIQDNRNTQALYQNGGEGWISPDDNEIIYNTVMNVCDTLDGAQDGIISNTEACSGKTEQIFTKLKDAGITDAQIDVIKVFNSPLEFDFKLDNQFDSIAGYSQLAGANLGRQFGATPTPSSYKEFGAMGQFSDQVLRYKVTKDQNFDSLTFDLNNWKKEIKDASKLLEASDPNLSAFKALGGKVILVHGTADEVVTPYGTIEYYEKLQDRFGGKLHDFMKFYMVPGYGHGGGTFTMTADLLGELDEWVVEGDEPTNLVAKDRNHDRTRPLCEYPAWPKHNGTGNINDASSFTCVQ